MGSKAVLFLCLSLAVVLMIASEVAARELAETSTSVETNSKADEYAKGLGEAKYPGGGYQGGGYPGGGYQGGGGYPGGGYRGGGGYPGGGYRGRGGYPGGGYQGGGGYPGGGYRGPGGGRGGGGGGGGGEGYCRFGCCGRSYYGGGCRCCSYAGEAVDAEP